MSSDAAIVPMPCHSGSRPTSAWRDHDDVDVGVRRSDAPAVHRHLAGWDLHVVAGGVLSPWDGRPLDEASAENNVWGRRTPTGPWVIDVQLLFKATAGVPRTTSTQPW